MKVNHEHLKSFVDVAPLSSYSEVARESDILAPAPVWRKVHDLEKALWLKLFERTGKGCPPLC